MEKKAVVRTVNFKVHRNSLTSWKSESDAEGSQGQLVQKQKVHVHTGKEKARENGQRYSHCQINKFTYSLKIKKQERMIKGKVTVKSTSSRTRWKRESKREWSKIRSLSNQQVHIRAEKEKARKNGQIYDHCQINKFTYRLKIRKQERMPEWSKVRSLSNQQVHVQSGIENAREHGQRRG